MGAILIATLVVGIVGLIIGVALVFAGNKFYVEVDEDLRLERYIKRAINSRNQTKEDALKQYERIAECAAIHLRPQRKYADVIINGHATIEDLSKIAEDFGNCF